MQYSNISSGALPTFGIELTPDRTVDETAAHAAVAEQSGIDAGFVSNHFDNRDPFQTLAAIGRATDNFQFGPGVVNPRESHPVRLATQTATLAEQFPNRVLCGIGAGDRSTLAKLGFEHDRPVTRVAETVGIVRKLTSGERVTADGIYELDEVGLSYEPPAPVPIFVGAQGPTMVRMTAERADALLMNGSHPRDYEAAREHISAGSERRDASRDALTVLGFACVSVAESSPSAREVARPPVAFVTAGAPDAQLERHGIDREAVRQIRHALATGDHASAYERVTERMIDTFSVAGSVAEVADELRTLATHVDGIVAGAPLGPDRKTAIELLGSVATRLREDAVIDE